MTDYWPDSLSPEAAVLRSRSTESARGVKSGVSTSETVSDGWLADLIVTTAEFAVDCGLPVPDLSGYMAALSGAANEADYYSGALGETA